MLRPRRIPLVILAAAVWTAPLSAQTTAFTGATVWDGTGAASRANATIVVREGRVVSVGAGAAPADATVVDLAGRWVIPGLIDTHVHVTGEWAPAGVTDAQARVEEDLRLLALYGVTTANSLGNEPIPETAELRATQGTPDLQRARVFFAGPVIASTEAAEAATAVARNDSAGVDWIKIRVDDNLGTATKMPWPAVESVISTAHGRGLRVATHLFYLDDAKRLLRLGTDLVAHSVRDAVVDAELIGLLKERNVCYVPTLTREISTFVYAERPGFFDDPFFQRWADQEEVERVTRPSFQQQMAVSTSAARYREGLRTAQGNLKTLWDAGVPIAMGTDAGPAGRFPGYFEHVELDLMVEAGLTPAQALTSATAVAARCLGLEDVGTLEPGRWADFLVLDADPLADIANTKRLRTVYVAGNEVR